MRARRGSFSSCSRSLSVWYWVKSSEFPENEYPEWGSPSSIGLDRMEALDPLDAVVTVNW